VLRLISAALCEVFSITPMMTDGLVENNPCPRSADLNPPNVQLCGHLKSLLYAAAVDSEKALDDVVVDARQTTSIGIYLAFIEWIKRPISRHVEAYI
jgi:hypothetical protein